MSRPRFVSLNLKLALAIVPLIIIFMGFNFFVILRHEHQILQQETEKRALSLATGLAILSSEALRTFSEYQLQQNVDQFARLKDVVSVGILDPQGKVVAHSDAQERGKTLTDPLTRDATARDSELVSTQSRQRILTVYRPIMVESRRMGTVMIELSLRGLDQALARSQRSLTGLTLILLAGATFFVGFLARWFTTPLLRLAHVARDLARGNLSARAVVKNHDEVGILGAALNHMTMRLQELIESEKHAREKLQQRVANLLEFTDRVVCGDLTGEAPAGDDDEMGRLTLAVNEMVRHLRIILEDERAMRETVERSRAELEEANEKLKELDQLKSEFLNTVSHELRTPLTSIKAFAEILLDNAGEDIDTQMEFLGIINKESDRLTRLINNLLDLSRIEAGRMNWDFEDIDFQEIVDAACLSLRVAAEKKEIIFEIEPASEPLPAHGDHDKLVQVITNLVGNAIKFTPPGGKIRVTARRDDDHLEVMVEDSGLGIAPEHHAKIFEKFGQVDTSETREIKGSGLGLPIARSIIEAHKGTLTVDSEKGKGARFYVRMPLRADSEPSPPREVPVMAFPAAIRPHLTGPPEDNLVLVVDDEIHIRRFLHHVLEQEGFQVVEATTGREAVELASTVDPQLILLDLMLPDVNGFDVLAELKQQESTREVPVIILSIIQDMERCYRLGASDFLTKPIDRERLLERIRHYTGATAGGLNLMVVEDDESVLRALTAMLEHQGYTVHGCPTGEAALEHLATGATPDLILLDLMLPGLTGHDVLRVLRQGSVHTHVPVIVLTAAGPDERTRALGMGANSVVTKPFTEAELASMVRAMLAEATVVTNSSNEGEAQGQDEGSPTAPTPGAGPTSDAGDQA